MLLSSKMEEWGHELNYMAASGSWQGHGNGISSRKECSPASVLILAHFRLLNLRTVR
jgi:hypothetical protein